MNILRLSTFSLTIVLFTMGVLILPVNTALAHCKGPHENLMGCADHSHGGGGGGDAEAMYTVNMTLDSTFNRSADPIIPEVLCTGTADKRLGPGFLPNSCKVSLTDLTYGTQDYCLFGVSVKNTNKGTRVMLFMTRDCDFGNSTGDGGYHTLELAADLMLDPGLEAPDFHIVVHHPEGGAVLTKINQPNKNVPLDDKIFIDDIVYTLDPVDP